MEERQAGPKRRRVIFRVDADGADALANEPVLCDGETVGWVTSGGYCHHVGASIALGYVPAGLAGRTGGFQPAGTMRSDGGDRLYDGPESLVRRLEYGLRYGNTYPSCLASLA